tara:strand:+ start:338 stop:973 length:636 start_codon:yes stop_codon:yes gene_type:complete
MTDVVGFCFPPMVAVYFNIRGQDMPDGFETWMLALIGYAFAGVLVLRLLSAPYFIWKEDQARICQLEMSLDRPNQQMRERLAETLASSRIQLADGLSTFNHFVLSYEAEENHKPNAVFVLMRQIEPMNSLKERFMGDAEFAKLWGKHYSESLAWFFKIPVRSDYEDHGEFLIDMLSNDYTDMNKSYRALMDWLLANPAAESEPQSLQDKPA